MSTTLDLSSIGYLCGCIQQSPNAITRAAEKLGIVAAAKINGITHFSCEQVEAITAHFRDRKGTDASDRH